MREGEFEFGEKVEIKKVPVGLKSKGERVYSGVAGRWTGKFGLFICGIL